MATKKPTRKKRQRRSKAEMEALREQARGLYLRSMGSLRAVARDLGLSTTTVNKWAREGEWEERRAQMREEIRQSRNRDLAERLRFEQGAVVEEAFDSTRKIAGRMIAYLLNGGDYCAHCGRGADSGHPLQRSGETPEEFAERKHLAAQNVTFRFKPEDLLKFERFALELTGIGLGGATRGEDDVEDDLDDDLLADLALQMARVEGGADPLSSEVTELRERVTALEVLMESFKAAVAEEVGDERATELLRAA